MLLPDLEQAYGLAGVLTNFVPNAVLQGRGAATCAATLPASCQLLNSRTSVLLLGTIPYVCLSDTQKLSGPLYSLVSAACSINFLQTGTQFLACLQSGLAANQVSVPCSSTTSTAKSTSSSTSASVSTANVAAAVVSTTASTSSAKSISASQSSVGTSVSISATGVKAVPSESIISGSIRQGSDPVPVTDVKVNGTVISTNTSVAVNSTNLVNVSTIATTTLSTVLVIARDSASAYSAYSGLNGYGIPYQVLTVPQAGASLPTLNGSALIGNFGAIVVLSEVSYDYGATGFQSALTTDQWTALHTYQLTFGVRMVRLDVFPSAESGTSAQGGCCDSNQEQLISISDSSAFPTAGLITGATMSTLGLYHYPATIIDTTIATPFAAFGTTTGFSSPSVAGVINNIGGRQQMVFFISFATNWSPTSSFLQHAWIHWATRGLYAGYRRVNFGTQVDDMFLQSLIYYPTAVKFRIRPADLDAIKAWIPQINAKMAPGSNYFMEIGHNGNGNIEKSVSLDTTGTVCGSGPIEYNTQLVTPLEFQKVLGTGTDIWPTTATKYFYSPDCLKVDPLEVWWATPANRDAFAHLTHTFTHESQNNATYNDIYKEISWNIAWLAQTGLASAKYFSAKGLIPPAITGTHNGDAIRAWSDNGITNCVGDNTRPVLLNTVNEHWPLMSTMAANGFDGMQITPRWATTIYYNCDSTICTVQEWIDTSAGSGDITNLLSVERAATSRHLLELHHDPYMFHQANLRQIDVNSTVVNGVSQQLSLIQIWVETVVNEMARLVTWPMITLKHDDISASFAARMARDGCNPNISLQLDILKKTITGVSVSTTGNTCAQLIPVTVPGTVKDTQGFKTEQIGKDPLTIWVKMSGKQVTFVLSSPIPW